MKIIKATCGAILLFGMLCVVDANTVYAIDWDAGDWFPTCPGIDNGLIYYQHVTRKKLYTNGKKTLGNADLTSDVTMFRYVHPIHIGDLVVSPNFVLPVGRLDPGGDLAALGKASGIGDLLLAFPAWVVNKPENRFHLVPTAYLILPTGSYDKNRPLNLGENRYKIDFQLGFSYGLGKHFTLELAPDVMWFTKNSNANAANATIRQKPLYQFMGYLDWHYSPTTMFALGLSWTSGGETSINGVSQHDKTGTSKWILTAATFISKHTHLMFSVGRDISVENGLMEDFRFNFRLMRCFPLQ